MNGCDGISKTHYSIMSASIYVIGSSNMDLITLTTRIPSPGSGLDWL